MGVCQLGVDSDAFSWTNMEGPMRKLLSTGIAIDAESLVDALIGRAAIVVLWCCPFAANDDSHEHLRRLAI